MAKKQQVDLNAYVKKSTLWFSIAGAFILGVYLGATVVSLNQPATMAVERQAPTKAPAKQEQEVVHDHEKLDQLKAEAEKDPQNAQVWIALGHAYFDESHFEEAIEAYKKSLAIEPKNADVWTDMGVMYRRAKQPQKAIESFDHALEVDPKHLIARFNKGVVYMHDLGDNKSALVSWEKILELDPNAKAPNGLPMKQLVEGLKANQ